MRWSSPIRRRRWTDASDNGRVEKEEMRRQLSVQTAVQHQIQVAAASSVACEEVPARCRRKLDFMTLL
ncbi:hypothetical protein PC116_g12886 [Phytophthora cactorum]|uniref:Uncharacterized protein n=1 Tax=Phytophthora cactorum TaxID=29920 RepID=A0A8T1KUN5_9STRA|nr:hypothetical protein PC117_g10216 [Phytophthora cactorum]KAG3024721.1 hypothetical protein PC119_g8358 [Phytophthora cactorum]KAG3189849.1 hypothetical protein PC128_g11591 [Phytophthora cactorum]KAG4239102.1 hypothetical protein PC116_g12886 [Phytophthora cactorum]